MNDRWVKQDGQPWFKAAERRAHKRFQRHVRTTAKPRARIRREPCFADPGHCIEAEAHHPDYTRPFLVLWVCLSCHRKVDHGSLRFKKTDLWDYSSLINQRPRAQKPCGRDEVPF
jgi:hypothetical protein